MHRLGRPGKPYCVLGQMTLAEHGPDRIADQIAKVEGDRSVENWLAPIVADGEAGFGGALNVYELQKAMIAAGVAGSPSATNRGPAHSRRW